MNQLEQQGRLFAIIRLMGEAFPESEGLDVLYEREGRISPHAIRYGARLTIYGQRFGFDFIIEDLAMSNIDEFTMRLKYNITEMKERTRSYMITEAL